MKKDLSENILPHFKHLFKSVINFEYFRLVLKGGRSSGKSIFIAMCLVIGTLIHRRSCVALVRYKVDVAKRLDNVFIKALNILGLRKFFRYVSTKHEFILLDNKGHDTDVSIICYGSDDPETLKGITPKIGSFQYLWIEEASNFPNINSIKNLESSVGRGDLFGFTSIISYNPRQNTSHFLNKEYENIVDNLLSSNSDNTVDSSEYISEITLDDEDENNKLKFKQCVFHCTYKSLIKYGHRDWISPTDLVDITIGERTNSEYYRWYYLGEVGALDGVNVFNNIKDWDGNIEQLTINHIDRGLDVGNGGPDPFAYTESYYDKKERSLYILNEYYDKGGETIVPRVATNIKRINPRNLSFFIDSAVPLIRDLFIKEHTQPLAVKKYPGSVEAGILWLQSLQGIYICKNKTPHCYKEFSEYEYKIDKYEEITNELPDKNNHCIDSIRYGNYNNIRL